MTAIASYGRVSCAQSRQTNLWSMKEVCTSGGTANRHIGKRGEVQPNKKPHDVSPSSPAETFLFETIPK